MRKWLRSVLLVSWIILLSGWLEGEEYQFVLKWGSYGEGDGQFIYPRGVAVDSDNYVYVVDSTRYLVQKFTSEGEFVCKWSTEAEPWVIAVDEAGYVYVGGYGQVEKFTTNGTFVTKWGSEGYGAGQFFAPGGIAAGGGYVYLGTGSRVQQFTDEGEFVRQWYDFAPCCAHMDVALDPTFTYLYVADLSNFLVKKFNLATGDLVTSWGSAGTAPGQFALCCNPVHIAVGPEGAVFCSEKSTPRLQKFTSQGEFITKWGQAGNDDGEFSELCGWLDLAVDKEGAVYVVDGSLCRVQKFSPAVPQTYKISGTVKDTSGIGISGVRLTLSGETSGEFITEENGFYQFLNLPEGNYTVTPSKANWTFEPEERNYSPLNSDQIDQDFIGTPVAPTYYIKGYVKNGEGLGISQVTVSLSGEVSAQVITGSDGYYEFLHLSSGNYTVTPSRPGWTFEPTERNYFPLNSNQEEQNFLGTALQPVYSIRGYVRDTEGKGIEGVLLLLEGQGSRTFITDSSGYYEFLHLSAGDYTLTPSKEGWTFSPPYILYLPLEADQTDQNFTGSLLEIYSISGYIKDTQGQPISEVKVTLSGDASKEFITQTDGYYQFSDLVSGNYTVTPCKEGWIFNPESRSYTPLQATQENQDFLGFRRVTEVTEGKSNYILTPHDSKANDFLVFPGKTKIYNLQGELVKEITQPGEKWEGEDKKGRVLPAGIYIFRTEKSDRTFQSGTVVIIR